MKYFPENIQERLFAYNAMQLKEHIEDASTLIQNSIHLLNPLRRITRSDVRSVFNFIRFIYGKVFFHTMFWLDADLLHRNRLYKFMSQSIQHISSKTCAGLNKYGFL